MKLNYSDKLFLRDAKTFIENNKPLEITFTKKWHRNILKNQVKHWHTTSEEIKLNKEFFKTPSNTCMIFMNKLLTIHFLALSANYKLTSEIFDDLVILKYAPQVRKK